MTDRARSYAEWLVSNKDKQGTPEFETVSNAYKKLRSEPAPESEERYQTWPERLVRGVGEAAWGALTLPKDMYEGKVGMTADDPEMIRRTTDAALLATPASPASRFAPRVSRRVEQATKAPPGSELMQAATRQKVRLPRAVASESKSVNQLGETVSNIAIAGTPLKNASQQAIDDMGQAATRVQGGYGSANMASTGEAVKRGIDDYISLTDARVGKAYDRVDDLVDPVVKAPIDATRRLVQQLEREAAEAALPVPPSVGILREALGRNEGLTYKGLKDLRTRIGKKQKGGLLPGDDAADLKRIYGALTDDLEAAVMKSGSERAKAAWRRANDYRRLLQGRWEKLKGVLKANSDEKAFDALIASAGSSSRADLKLLRQARKALGGDIWDDVSATVVSRIGRDADGNFSPARYLTGFGKLSKEGKDVLFNSTGRKELRQALDDLATISRRYDRLAKFANPSGTSQSGTAAGLAVWAYFEPMTAIGAVLGGRAAAEALSKPAVVKAVTGVKRAQVARQGPAAIRRTVNVLAARLAAAGYGNQQQLMQKLMAQEQPSEGSE